MTELYSFLNSLSDAQAEQALRTCCAAERWVRAMVLRRPFHSSEGVLASAREVWSKMERADILQAFEGHPQIGGELTALREKYTPASAAVSWSAQEQASVAGAGDEVLLRLRDGNAAYLARFGHIFIVCASGKSAAQMLTLLEGRLSNSPELELEIAAHEQEKILLLRLQKLPS